MWDSAAYRASYSIRWLLLEVWSRLQAFQWLVRSPLQRLYKDHYTSEPIPLRLHREVKIWWSIIEQQYAEQCPEQRRDDWLDYSLQLLWLSRIDKQESCLAVALQELPRWKPEVQATRVQFHERKRTRETSVRSAFELHQEMEASQESHPPEKHQQGDLSSLLGPVRVDPLLRKWLCHVCKC